MDAIVVANEHQMEIEVAEEANNMDIPSCRFDEISVKHSKNVILGQNLTVHGNVSIVSGYNRENKMLLTASDVNKNDNTIKMVLNEESKRQVLGTKGRWKVVTAILFVILLVLYLFLTHIYSPNNKSVNQLIQPNFEKQNNTVDQSVGHKCLLNNTIQLEEHANHLLKSIQNETCIQNGSIFHETIHLKNRTLSVKTDIRFVVPKSLLFRCTFINNFNCQQDFNNLRVEHIKECFYDMYYHFIIGVNGKYYKQRPLNCEQDKKFESINNSSTLIVGVSYCYSGSILSNIKGNGEFNAIKNLLVMLKSVHIIDNKVKLHFPNYCNNSFVVRMLTRYCQNGGCHVEFYSSNRAVEHEILLDTTGNYVTQKQLSVADYDQRVGSTYDILLDEGLVSKEPYICVKKYFAAYMNTYDLYKLRASDIACRIEELKKYKSENMYDKILLRHIVLEEEKYVLDLIYIRPENIKVCDDIADFIDNLNSSLQSCQLSNKHENSIYVSFIIITSEMNSEILTLDVCDSNLYHVDNYLPVHLMFDVTISDFYDKYKNCQYLT